MSGGLAWRTGSAYGAPASAPVASPCFPVGTQEHVICNAAPRPFPADAGTPRPLGPRRLPARQRTRRPGSLKITASCLPTRLLHWHADCKSAPRARAGSHRASSQASCTPSRRRLNKLPGLLSPMLASAARTPHPTQCLTLPSPRVFARPNWQRVANLQSTQSVPRASHLGKLVSSQGSTPL